MRTRLGMLAVFLLALTLIAGCRQAQPPNSGAETPFVKADPAKTRGASSASLFFLNSQLGWAAVNLETQQPPASIIMRTSDGGQNWVQLNSPGLTVIRGLAFADELHGWTLVSADAGSGKSRFSIMATADGGHTWSQQWSQEAQQEGRFYRTQFFSVSQGLVQLNNTILATADGGGSWVQRPGPEGATSFSFTSPQEGWAAGSNGSIWHTADAGATWTSQWTVPDKIKDEFAYGSGYIDFTQATGGWALFEGEGSMSQFAKLVLHADDRGGNWSVSSASLPGDLAIYPNNDTPRYRMARFAPVSADAALLAASPPTDYPVLYRTADRGASWKTLSDGMSASPGLPKSAWGDLAFVSDSEGWAAVITQPSSQADSSTVALLHTRDGGKTWTAQF